MAKLTAADRKALPASTFAGPERSFPIPDKGHAKSALGHINQAPASARPAIHAKAEAMLHGKGMACGGAVKKADGGMVGMNTMNAAPLLQGPRHNPDNRLPKHAMHVRGRNRGM